MSNVVTASVFTFKGKIQRYFKVVTFELAWLLFNHCTLELGGRAGVSLEFKISMVYRVSSWTDSQGYTERPCLEKQNKKRL